VFTLLFIVNIAALSNKDITKFYNKLNALYKARKEILVDLPK